MHTPMASNSTELFGSEAREGQEGMEVHLRTTWLGNGVHGWGCCVVIPLKDSGDGAMEQARRLDSKASHMRGGRSVAEVNEVPV